MDDIVASLFWGHQWRRILSPGFVTKKSQRLHEAHFRLSAFHIRDIV